MASFPRFLVRMPPPPKNRRDATTITSEIEAERRYLIDILRGLRESFLKRGRCQAKFDADAWECWQNYDERLLNKASQSVSPDLAGPIAGRTLDAALKIAALLEAAWGAPSAGSNLQISLPVMEVAIELAERCRKDGEKLAVEIGSNADEKKLQRFVQMVRATPGIARFEAARILKLDKWHMDKLQETAIDRELIVIRTRNTAGRAAKAYWLTERPREEATSAGA